MIETWIEGIRLFLPDEEEDHPLPSQMNALRQSVNLIPSFHYGCIQRIEVRGPDQHPRRGGGNDNVQRIVRLSHACFSEAYNDEYNITFLHEFGHLVDHAFGVTAYVQQLRTPASQALLDTPHAHRDGGTNGPGERIADCYMYYLLNEVAGVRSGGTPYQGAEGQRRFNILLASPAFTGPSGDRRT